MRRVLLTGATGFLGMEVLARLLEGGHEILALIRASDQDEADRRLRAVLERLYDEPGDPPVRAIPGDVTRPLPDLEADTIVHCAASIAFDDPLERAHAVNTLGTLNVMRAAERMGDLEHFVHVSTAYVAGRHEGVFREADLELGQPFRNTYEQTKHRAEQRVADSWLPVTVVRPSIVMGDSRTGWTSAFNVLYWPLQAFARGLIDVVPALADGLVDVVGVDYVAGAIGWLVDSGRPQGTLALVAGERAATTGEVIRLACEAFDRPPPALTRPGAGRLPDSGSVYLPYFDVTTRFDDSRARAVLGPAGISAAPLENFFGVLMDYARESSWGRRPTTREARARAIALPTI